MSRLVSYGQGRRVGKKIVGGLVLAGSAYMGVKAVLAATSFAAYTIFPIAVLGGAGYLGYRWLKSQGER